MLNSHALIVAALILGASVILASIIYWHGFSYESQLSHCTKMYETLLAQEERIAFIQCVGKVR